MCRWKDVGNNYLRREGPQALCKYCTKIYPLYECVRWSGLNQLDYTSWVNDEVTNCKYNDKPHSEYLKDALRAQGYEVEDK